MSKTLKTTRRGDFLSSPTAPLPHSSVMPVLVRSLYDYEQERYAHDIKDEWRQAAQFLFEILFRGRTNDQLKKIRAHMIDAILSCPYDIFEVLSVEGSRGASGRKIRDYCETRKDSPLYAFRLISAQARGGREAQLSFVPTFAGAETQQTSANAPRFSLLEGGLRKPLAGREVVLSVVAGTFIALPSWRERFYLPLPEGKDIPLPVGKARWNDQMREDWEETALGVHILRHCAGQAGRRRRPRQRSNPSVFDQVDYE